jgi:hypothetical protein
LTLQHKVTLKKSAIAAALWFMILGTLFAQEQWQKDKPLYTFEVEVKPAPDGPWNRVLLSGDFGPIDPDNGLIVGEWVGNVRVEITRLTVDTVSGHVPAERLLGELDLFVAGVWQEGFEISADMPCPGTYSAHFIGRTGGAQLEKTKIFTIDNRLPIDNSIPPMPSRQM